MNVVHRKGTAAEDWLIPLWLKLSTAVLLLGVLLILGRLLFGSQMAFLELITSRAILVSLALSLIITLFLICFWLFPEVRLTLVLYWLIRYLRGPICVSSLAGFVFLLTIRFPLFSLRGTVLIVLLLLMLLTGFLLKPTNLNLFPVPGLDHYLSPLTMIAGRIRSIPRWILHLFVAILPVLIILSVIYFILDSRLSNYRPYSFWNDETGYWVWIRAFSYMGMDAGYNAPNELIARAAFNPFVEGSFGYLIFYGTIGRLFGWSAELPLLINFTILSLATLVFLRVARLSPGQVLLTGFVLIFTWPVLLYLPMTSHETLNQAIGIILSVIFLKLISDGESASLPARIAFVLLTFLATLIRLSWGLLLIPVLYYSLRGAVLRRGIYSGFLGVGLYLSAIFLTGYLIAPVNNSIFQGVREGLTQGPQILLSAMWTQVEAMFKARQLNPNIAVTFQVFAIAGWGLVRLIRQVWQKVPLRLILQSREVFYVYSMFVLIAAGLMFYLQVAFYRTFTPSLLVIYLLQVARRDFRILATMMAINIVFFTSYMNFYRGIGDAGIIRADFTTAYPELAKVEARVGTQIVYNPAAASRWCNTLLIPLDYYDQRLTIIPPGIGISYVLDPQRIQFPIKSNYLLLDAETYGILADRSRVKLLDRSPIGDLYRNLDADCDDGS